MVIVLPKSQRNQRNQTGFAPCPGCGKPIPPQSAVCHHCSRHLNDRALLAVGPTKHSCGSRDGILIAFLPLLLLESPTREQRCWVHKTANILDKLPERLQPEAKNKLHQIWMAETRVDAEQAFDLFLGNLPGQVPESDRVPGQGSQRAADLLRLPRRALDSPANHKPLRVRSPQSA